MAEFKLGRIKFVYQGTWAPSTSYVVDDVVTVGGKTYICVISNTSSSLFTTDLNNITPYWNLVADGSQWKGTWTNGTYYQLGDQVQYGGIVYQCNTAHTSASSTATITATAFTVSSGTATLTYSAQIVQPFLVGSTITLAGFSPTQTSTVINNINTTFTVVTCSTTSVTFALTGTYTSSTPGTVSGPSQLGLELNLNSWTAFASNLNWINGGWTVNTRYKARDLVTYGGYTYLCNAAHVSANTTTLGLESNSGLWDTFNAGIIYQGTWSGSSVRYRLNDVVTYGADLWICTTQHTSTGTTLDNSKFSIFVNGFEFLNSYNSANNYIIGDTVTYGGYTYTCIQNNTSASPQTPSTANTYWQPFTTGFSFQGDWSNANSYKIGSVVRNDGYTYLAVADNGPVSVTASATTNTSVSFVGNINGTALTYVSGTVPTVGSVVSSTYLAAGTYIVSGSSPNFVMSQNMTGGQIGGYSSQSVTAVSNTVTVTSTTNLPVNIPVSFSGTVGSSLLSTTATYYVSLVLNSTTIVLSTAVGGSQFTVGTATGLTLTLTASPRPPYATYWSLLNSGLKWTPAQGTYTGLSGTNIIGTGSSAVFTVVAKNTAYTATPTTAGSGYNLNDTIKILGTSLGGLSPANDLTLTVSSVSGNTITAVNTSGISVTWATGTTYVAGDIVLWGVSSYICTLAHVAASGSRPDNDTTATYWNLLASGTEQAVLTTTGDMFYYGANGPTRLPIGTDGQILRVNNNIPAWQYYGQINNIVFVAPSGNDVTTNGQGTTIDKPWQSIRYACQQVEDGYLNTNAKMLLTMNKQFLIKETSNFILNQYSFNVTGTATTIVTVGGSVTTSQTTTANLYQGMPISFASSSGSIVAGTTYWVATIPNGTTFTIATSYANATAATPVLFTVGTGTANIGTYVYSVSKTERDAGLIIQGFIFDISRGGTYQTTVNMNSFFSNGTFISGVGKYDVQPFVASENYLANTLIPSVLSNAAPTKNYQTLNGVSTSVQATQQINSAYTSETGVATKITSLISLITTALTANTNTGMPAAITPNTTISIKTGTYNEILPVNVPSYTALVGDELRSTVVQPFAADPQLATVVPKSTVALNRIKALVPNLIANTAVIPSAGNTTPQQYLIYNSNPDTASASIYANTVTMTSVLTTGTSPVATITDPAGYDTGYFNGRRLVVANKQFLKDEVQAYYIANYSSIWTALSTADKAERLTNIGYIVDALQYDLTYQGNLATIIQARSYYSLGAFVYPAGEKTAILAVQTRIAAIIGSIATGVAITRTSGNVTTQDVSGTAGSNAAGVFAAARVNEIYNTTNTGTSPATVTPSISFVAAALTTANTNIRNATANIQASTVAWINNAYPNLSYNQATCSRDVGYWIDALCYDMMFASNFLSIKNAASYYKAITSAQLVISSQLPPTVGTVAYVSASLREVTAGRTGTVGSIIAGNNLKTSFNILYELTASGLGNEPAIVMPQPTNYNTSSLTNIAYATTTGSNATGITTAYGYALAQVQQNYKFLITETLQFITTNFSITLPTLGERDLRFILDSILYDVTYGGNSQSLVAGSSYYSLFQLQIFTSQLLAFAGPSGGLNRLKTVIGYVAQGQLVSSNGGVTSGNNVTQITTGNTGNAAAAGFIQDRIQNVINWINNAAPDTAVAPYTGWVNTELQNAYIAITSKASEIASDATVWVSKNYQAVTFSNSSLINRDAGLITNAMAYDMVFGSNFNAIQASRAFNRANASATNLRAASSGQLPPTLGAINFLYFKMKTVATSGAIAQIQNNIDDLTAYLAGGAAPNAITWSQPALPAALTTGTTYTSVSGSTLSGGGSGAVFTIVRGTNGNGYYNYQITPTTPGSSYTTSSKIKILGSSVGGTSPAHDFVINITQVNSGAVQYVTYSDSNAAAALLDANRAFLLAEVVAYINANYSSITSNPQYTVAKTKRDMGFILDALHYDLIYGGNWATSNAGMAYYSALYGTQITSGFTAAFVGAINYISGLAQTLVVGSTVASPLQINTTQVNSTTSGLTGGSIHASIIQQLAVTVTAIVTNGLTAGVPTATIVTIGSGTTFTTGTTTNTITNTNGTAVTITAASYIQGTPIATGGSVTTTSGLSTNTTYYVAATTTNSTTVTLATTLANALAGTAITFTGGSTAISNGAVTVGSANHGLSAGDMIIPQSSTNGLVSTIIGSGTPYYVLSSGLTTTQFQLATSYNGTAITSFTSGTGLTIPVQTINMPSLSFVSTTSLQAYSVVSAAIATYQTQVVSYINTNYPALVYSNAYAQRDTNNTTLASILDVMLGSNFASIQAGRAYNRTQDYQVLGYELTATTASLYYLSSLISTTLTTFSTQATAMAANFQTIINYLTKGQNVTPEVNGTINYNNTLGVINGAEILRANIPFLAAEIIAYYAANFGGTVSSISASVITTSANHNLNVNDPVMFSGTSAGGITTNTLYYVLATPTNTTFTITTSEGYLNANTGSTGAPVTLSVVASPTMTVAYYHVATGVNSTTSDITYYMNAIIYDLQYTGNYRTLRTAQVLLSAVNGSITQNMWLVRNACGVRNMTMNGLTGILPSTVNSFGTKRPTGGAYTSLDPGFGPNDSNAWVYSRSCYVQNCTMFGYAVVGARVDGALHNGGNRSMVANDYTCIIGDGLGWHTTGAGSLSELVSVFNYYSYAGYMAELGGRIRATNGNSSYGVYGVVAEGVDTTEVAIYGTLNNRYNPAQITNTVTDATNAVLRLEYGNAGSNYTNTTTTIAGSGYNANVNAEELRDASIFEARLIDTGTTSVSSIGGTSYVTATNTSQGTSNSGVGTLTIAATDGALTNSYNQMRMQLIAGTGVGQYANILTYVNGSKVAQVIKDSFAPILITSSSTTVFNVASTASLYAGMPIYLNTTYAGLTGATTAGVVSPATLYYVQSTNFTATQFSVYTAATGGVTSLSAVGGVTVTVTATATTNNLITATNSLAAGQGITFSSSFNGIDSGTIYYVLSLNLSGSAFAVSTYPSGPAVTITATGSASSTGTVGTVVFAAGWDHVVPGTTIQNTLDLTTGYIIEPRISYSAPGYTSTIRTITSAAYAGVAYGAGSFVAVASGGTTSAYSTNGTTWTAGGSLGSGTTWTNVVYGGGQGAKATAVVGGFGGTGATFSYTIASTQITSITVVNGGYNYTTPPTIVITGGNGSGATATCTVLNGAIQTVTMVINGSGYTGTPTITAVTGIVSSVTMNSWGKNYYTLGNCSAVFSQPQGLTPTAFALNTAVTLGQYLQTATGRIYYVAGSGTTSPSVTPAFDYTSTTYTGVANGSATLNYVATQAQGTITLTNNGISAIALSVAGYGYTSVPSITIADSGAFFMAVCSGSTAVAYATPTGIASAWSLTTSYASNQNLRWVAYGGGQFVTVGGSAGTGVALASNTPNTLTLKGAITTPGGSAYYSSVAYGAGVFVAVCTGSSTVSSYTPNSSANWYSAGALPSATNWTSVAFGNNRFVALAANGYIALQFITGLSTTSSTAWVSVLNCVGTTTSILSSSLTWTNISYGQGLFFAVASGTSVCATSPDGINWTIRAMPSSSNWSGIALGTPISTTLGSQPIWAAVSSTSGTAAGSIRTGATTSGRLKAFGGLVIETRLVEPGSGYPKGNVTATTATTNVITVDDTTNLSTSLANNQPIEFTGLDAYGLTTNVTYYVIGSTVTSTQFSVASTVGSTTTVTLSTGSTLAGTYRAGAVVTQYDPNRVTTAGIRTRMGDGALANPTFLNRGTNNATATSSTSGDGYGDLYQNSAYINVSGLYSMPSAGSNVQFSTITGSSQWYKLVTISNQLGSAGNYTATFQINPSMTTLLAPTQGTLITTRLKYSQVRLTGHDFLYIGTGNQTQTNYPYVIAANAIQANQSASTGGGRVFFTSTDQDGNFNVGNLFGVQQSTGTATLNANAFNLAGLQSLTLGAVSLGIGSATITQFSTDPYFTANSDNVLPTQKAIKAYITAQIGGGSSSLNVNTITSGQIYIANNTISNTTGNQIYVSSKMLFTGGIDGSPVALAFFIR